MRQRDTSNLLIDDRRMIAFLPSLARLLGERRAIVLQQLWFLARTGVNVGGVRYVFLTYAELQRDHFPWINASSIRAVLYDLEKRKLIRASPTVGPRGETGWSVDRESLMDLFDIDPDGGCEPEAAEEPDGGPDGGLAGGVPIPNTPRTRNRFGARALRTPPCAISAPPPVESARTPLLNARAPSVLEENERRESESERVEGEQYTTAAAHDGRSREIANAAAAVVVEPGKPQDRTEPPPPVPPADPIAVELLVAASFDPTDAASLVAGTGASADQVRSLLDAARRLKDRGKLRSTIRGFIVAGLSRGDPPQPSGQQLVRLARERPRGVEHPPSDREQPAETERALRKAHELLSHLALDDLQALAEHTLGLMPPATQDFLRPVVVKRGPLQVPTLVRAMADAFAAGWSMQPA